jgi:methionyl-tRNA formyltransferase
MGTIGKAISIVFWGTPWIALPTLEYLHERFNVLAVVTQPDRPAGRGHKLTPSPVKEFALAHNLPLFQPKSIRKEPEIQAALCELKPDFFVTFAFGQILSQEVLDIPKFETVNLHASLLPKYRGANPIQRAIINGEKETGITTMITVLELDAGDICMTEKITILDNMTCNDLSRIISEKSPALIEKTLIKLYDGSLKPIPQCTDGVCVAAKLDKSECEIDWNKPAQDIHNLVRGVCPAAYFMHEGKRIKVLETCITDGELVLTKVKPEGKCEMSLQDWQRGLK